MLLIIQTKNVTVGFVSGDGTWGNCQNGSSCTGMVGMVNRKEVDFAIGISFLLSFEIIH